MNRRGEEILSVYWFLILVIVAGGIVLMVSTFYGKPYDVQTFEAQIMINKVVDCLSDENGILREDVNSENFIEECSFDFGDNGEFYLEIENLGIAEGNFNLKEFCELNEESVVCVDRNIYFLDADERENIIKILSAISK